MQGDYRGCNVGGTKDNIAILKTFGKPIVYRKEDVDYNEFVRFMILSLKNKNIDSNKYVRAYVYKFYT